MKATDTIRVTRTTLESQKADALGRGTQQDLDEADFCTLLVTTLHAVAQHAAMGAAPHGQRDRDSKAITAGAEALGRYMHAFPDLSLLGTFTTVHQLIADRDEVAPSFACPVCGERNMDNLEHDGDNEVDCTTCRAHYTTDTVSATDTRPEWFRLPSGLTMRIYVDGGAYTSERL